MRKSCLLLRQQNKLGQSTSKNLLKIFKFQEKIPAKFLKALHFFFAVDWNILNDEEPEPVNLWTIGRSFLHNNRLGIVKLGINQYPAKIFALHNALKTPK
jgi:hypothetical protein